MRFHKPRPDAPPGNNGDTASPAEPDGLDLAALIRDGAIDVVPGHPPVPINVLRLADTDRHHDLTRGMSPSLAALLVGHYTDPRDTLIDFDADPSIEGAAGANGCRYLPVHSPASLADLDPVAGHTKLISLRWPHPGRPVRTAAQDRAELDALFTACRSLLAPNGRVIVALTPPPATRPDHGHTHELVPAAYRAGLGYLQHLLVIKAPIPGERPTNLTTPAGPATLRAALPQARHTRDHHDLLLFVLPRSRGRSAKPSGVSGDHDHSVRRSGRRGFGGPR